MSARVHLASEFTMARNGYTREGRLILGGGGARGFMWDTDPSYPHWGFTDNTIIANERLARASLLWLTGKATGMRLLLFTVDAPRNQSWGDTWFEDFVTRTGVGAGGVRTDGLEGTLDYSGVSLGSGGWDSYDPLDYDAVLLPSMNPTYAYPFVDDYLAAKGAIWGFTNITAEYWQRYGFNNGTGYQAYVGPPDYLRPAFECAPLGTGTYQYGIFSSTPVAADTNTIGGTSTIYDDCYGLWTQG